MKPGRSETLLSCWSCLRYAQILHRPNPALLWRAGRGYDGGNTGTNDRDGH